MSTNLKNQHTPAYPEPITNSGHPGNGHTGLTKRELIAAMAMQGILSNSELLKQFSGQTLNGAAYQKLVTNMSIGFADNLLINLTS